MPASPFLGDIILFGGNFAIRGFALCQGQLLPIASNTALFSLYGTIYGGDGRTTFALPDLRSRVPIHEGTGPGLSSRPIGSTGGEETVTLSNTEIPAHTHAMNVNAAVGNTTNPESNFLAAQPALSHHAAAATGSSNMKSNAISNAGGAGDHNNLQPYLAISYLVAITGVYPSRN